MVVPDVAIDHRSLAREQLRSMSPEELDADLGLEGFFGISYVINLPHARERLRRVTDGLHEVGLRSFRVWEGTNGRNADEVPEHVWRKMSLNWLELDAGTPFGAQALEYLHQGEAGCYLSHFRLLRFVRDRFQEARRQVAEARDAGQMAEAAARARAWSSVLVMEDDNGFGFVDEDRRTARRPGVGRLLREAMAELPPDWDMLYFMAESEAPAIQVSPHLKQLRHGLVTNAYAVSHRMYDALVERLGRIEDPAVVDLRPVDGEMATLHETHRCYAISPAIAYQREGQSQVVGWTLRVLRQLHP
jgi:hypothetical protein